MTPVERLQAAIEKLEAAQGETWYFTTPSDEGLLSRQGWIDAVNPGGGRQVLGLIGPADAGRILMLHRTIDAQLAILRFAVDGLYDLPEFLMLADAILGSDR